MRDMFRMLVGILATGMIFSACGEMEREDRQGIGLPRFAEGKADGTDVKGACPADSDAISFRLSQTSLDVQSMQVTTKDFGYEANVSGGQIVHLFGPLPKARNLALRGCVDNNGQFNIQEITFQLLSDWPAIHISVSEAEFMQTSGLQASLFGTTSNQLNVRVGLGYQTFVLKALKVGQETWAGFSIAYDDKLSPYAVVGNLEIGDPFADQKSCLRQNGQHGRFIVKEYLFDTAVILAEGCAFQGSGRSSIYEFHAVEVKDKSNKVPEAYRGKTLRIENPRLQELLINRESHHNWCDTFYLKVPEFGAEYMDKGWDKPLEGLPFDIAFRGVRYSADADWKDLGHPQTGMCY